MAIGLLSRMGKGIRQFTGKSRGGIGGMFKRQTGGAAFQRIQQTMNQNRSYMQLGNMRGRNVGIPSAARVLGAAAPVAALHAAPYAANLSTAFMNPQVGGTVSKLLGTQSFFQNRFSPFANQNVTSSMASVGDLMRRSGSGRFLPKNAQMGLTGNVGSIGMSKNGYSRY